MTTMTPAAQQLCVTWIDPTTGDGVLALVVGWVGVHAACVVLGEQPVDPSMVRPVPVDVLGGRIGWWASIDDARAHLASLDTVPDFAGGFLRVEAKS